MGFACPTGREGCSQGRDQDRARSWWSMSSFKTSMVEIHEQRLVCGASSEQRGRVPHTHRYSSIETLLVAGTMAMLCIKHAVPTRKCRGRNARLWGGIMRRRGGGRKHLIRPFLAECPRHAGETAHVARLAEEWTESKRPSQRQCG